ncbi:jg13013 [Pararge aegeria aegeria]|uniref:Jg13013 protein n=1 Tax=Pararge aegeria aegeria TaxID=348720 RepID=A0A8S4SPM8_9NEOP|nr:jg13013 [Pararge aegeria aegeria]
MIKFKRVGKEIHRQQVEMPERNIDVCSQNKISVFVTQAKLHSLQHRRNVACLAVFFRIYFGECAQELHSLVPPAPFFYRTTRRRERWHPYVVDTQATRTKRYSFTVLIRTAKFLNALPALVFPDSCYLNAFKARVNRHILGKRAPP